MDAMPWAYWLARMFDMMPDSSFAPIRSVSPRTPRPPQPTIARQIMSPVASSQWDATPPTIALYSG